jgi:hypothetical protein
LFVETPLNQRKVDLVISGHTHKGAHLPPNTEANQYSLAILSPTTVLQVGVTQERLSVEWREPGVNVPKALSIPRAVVADLRHAIHPDGDTQ